MNLKPLSLIGSILFLFLFSCTSSKQEEQVEESKYQVYQNGKILDEYKSERMIKEYKAEYPKDLWNIWDTSITSCGIQWYLLITFPINTSKHR